MVCLQNYRYEFTLMAFDLAQEKCREVPCPTSDICDSSLVHYMTALGGFLCEYDDYGTCIWVMKKYGGQESWTNIKGNDAGRVSLGPLCMVGATTRVGS